MLGPRITALGAGLVALAAAGPAFSQEEGGLRLTFGVEERLETSENLALADPSSGSLTSSTTTLSFGLVSETRTEVLRFGLSGGVRLEAGDAAADPDLFGHPSLDLFYSRSGANSALSLSASAQRNLLATAAPTPENPDPFGSGSQTVYAANATFDLGQTGPIGLTLQADRSGTTYDSAEASFVDNRTLAVSATAHLRFPAYGEMRLIAAQSRYEEGNQDLQRDSHSLKLGWALALSPTTALDAELGYERLDTMEFGVLTDRTEGLVGKAALSWELANGTAGLSIAQTNDPGAGRVTVKADRFLDLGNQTVTASLGATQQAGSTAAVIGALKWTYAADFGDFSVDLGRSVTADDIGIAVTTDHLTLDLNRPLSPVSNLGLSVTASRIDDSSANLVDRMEATARYSRELGSDWAMNLGATFQSRDEATVGSADSRLLFISVSRSFDWRP